MRKKKRTVRYDPEPKPAFLGYEHRSSRIEYKQDPIVEEVLNRIQDRADLGMIKYGTSMMREDVDTLGWIDHAIEELLDAALYLTRLKRNL